MKLSPWGQNTLPYSILRKADEENEECGGNHDRRLEIAAAFTRLAALERGLLPPG